MSKRSKEDDKPKRLQKRIGKWARAYWPDRTAEGHVLKMMEEMGEVAECFVKEHKRGGLGEELADVVIAAFAVADRAPEDIDLMHEVISKLRKNEFTKTPGSR